MKKFWPIIYVLLSPFAIYSGYREISESTADTNPDWIFIKLTFVVCVFFPLGSVAYGFTHSKKEKMEKPSWDRHPLGWWTDTLQPVRFCLVSAVLYATGALFALPRADEKGRLMCFLLFAIAVGVFLGERLVYAIYRNRIGT